MVTLTLGSKRNFFPGRKPRGKNLWQNNHLSRPSLKFVRFWDQRRPRQRCRHRIFFDLICRAVINYFFGRPARDPSQASCKLLVRPFQRRSWHVFFSRYSLTYITKCGALMPWCLGGKCQFLCLWRFPRSSSLM